MGDFTGIRPPVIIADEFRSDVRSGMTTADLVLKYGKHKATINRYKQYVEAEDDYDPSQSYGERSEKDIDGSILESGNDNEPGDEDDEGGTEPHIDSVSQDFQDKGNKWNISMPRTTICSEEELIKFFKVDTDIWEVERFVVNSWEMGYKNKEHEAQSLPLYQVKAWLRKKKVQAATKLELAAMKEEAKLWAPDYKSIMHIRDCAVRIGNMLEISIPDLHLGKYAWAEEAGENYDVAIAENVFFRALEELIRKTSVYNVEKICFIIGNDLLNTDTITDTTTRGTPQNVDGRHLRTFRKTRQLLTAAIDRLREIAPVDALVVPGNHDQSCAFYIGDALECWFAKCPDVNIDNSAPLRKYYEYGKVMLLFTHGSEEKPANLPQIMAIERPELWGRTKYREAHIGHLHQKRTWRQEIAEAEFNGVRVRMLPSLTAADAWHYSMGYVGNIRSAEAYVWSPVAGLEGTAVFNLPTDLE